MTGRLNLPVLGILIFIAVVASLVYFSKKPADIAVEPAGTKSTRDIALLCTSDEQTRYHIHVLLMIVINGVKTVIPANIGITSSCMKAIHTHDDTGELHIESPEKRDFRLSDFFAVWGKVYNRSQILDYKTDTGHIIRETVNGKEVFDFENTLMRDKDSIIISYESR